MADEVAQWAVKLTGNVGSYVASMEHAERAGTNAARAAGQSETAVARAGSTAEKSGRHWGGLGSSMSAGAKRFAVGGALVVGAAAAIGMSAVTLAANFDTTMRQVAVATNQPASAVEGLRKLALKMGQDTVFSAGEAGDAMLELAKGGMSAAQIKGGALASTLTLASAGGLQLGEAAGDVVSGLSLFNLTANKSSTVAAALAGAANASQASVSDMGLALAQVGPGARNAGLSLQETTAVLAAFAQNGILGSDAGTSLKTMLTRLVPTTSHARKEMKALGLDFTDAHGSFLPISQVAQQLHDKLGPLSQKQRSLALSTIFGSDATRAATVLMHAGAAGVNKLVKATSDQTQAQKMAAAAMGGTHGALEQMRGSVETAKIAIGTALAPAVSKIALLIAAWANKTSELIGFLQQHHTTAAALAVALGVIGTALLVIGINAGIAWVAALGPIPWIVLAIAGLAAGVKILWDRFATFRVVVSEVMLVAAKAVHFFVDAALTYFGFFINGAAKLFGWVPGLGGGLKSAANLFNNFKNSVDHTFDQIEAHAANFAAKQRMHAEAVAVNMSLPLVARLPQYKAIAMRYGVTLETVLKTAGVHAGVISQVTGNTIGTSFINAANSRLKKGETSLSETAASVVAQAGNIAAASARGGALGKAFMQGINAGIRSGALSLSEAAASVVANADAAARAKTKTHSPSLVWQEHGQMLVAGLVRGMQGGAGAVRAAAAALLGEAAASGRGVSLSDVQGAAARANQTPTAAAEVARDAAVADRLAAQGPADAARKHAAATKAAADAAARHRDELIRSTRAAENYAHSLHRAAQGAGAHAKALLGEARQADDTARRLRQQLTDARTTATRTADAAAVAATTAKDRGQALVDAIASTVTAQAALADAVYAAQVEKSRTFVGQIGTQIDALVTKADSLRSAFSGSVTQGTGLQDLFTAGQDTGIASVESVIAGMTSRVADAQTFASDLGALTAAGMNDTLISQIAAAGPATGDAMARAILAAGPAAIAQMNDLSTSLATVAATGLDGVVSAFYAAGVSSAEALLAPIRAAFPELAADIDAITARGATVRTAPAAASTTAPQLHFNIQPQGLMMGTAEQLAAHLAGPIRETLLTKGRIGGGNLWMSHG